MQAFTPFTSAQEAAPAHSLHAGSAQWGCTPTFPLQSGIVQREVHLVEKRLARCIQLNYIKMGPVNSMNFRVSGCD